MGFYENDATDGSKRLPNMLDSFIRITPEYPTVLQVLEPKITKDKNVIWRHYIPQALRKSGKRGLPIVCPGIKICPICQKNAKLADKKHPDYIAPQKRLVVNVLDLTPTRKCPLCSTESYTKVCPKCDNDLSKEAVAPSNTVKLLERGVTLFQQLNLLEENVKIPYDPNDVLLADANPNKYIDTQPGELVPAGITRFPITLISSRDGKGDLIITPVPGAVNNLNWHDYEKMWFNLDATYFILTPVEINKLLAGGSLSEVLKARQGKPDSATPDTDEVPF